MKHHCVLSITILSAGTVGRLAQFACSYYIQHYHDELVTMMVMYYTCKRSVVVIGYQIYLVLAKLIRLGVRRDG